MFKHLVERFNAPTPTFWKKVQKFGTSLVGLSVSLIAIPHAPAAFTTVSIVLGTIGGTLIPIAQFAVENTSDLTTN